MDTTAEANHETTCNPYPINSSVATPETTVSTSAKQLSPNSARPTCSTSTRPGIRMVTLSSDPRTAIAGAVLSNAISAKPSCHGAQKIDGNTNGNMVCLNVCPSPSNSGTTTEPVHSATIGDKPSKAGSLARPTFTSAWSLKTMGRDQGKTGRLPSRVKPVRAVMPTVATTSPPAPPSNDVQSKRTRAAAS